MSLPRPTHLRGPWVRVVYLSSVPLGQAHNESPEGGDTRPPTHHIQAPSGSFLRVLETLDPNSGQGGGPETKPRFQYFPIPERPDPRSPWATHPTVLRRILPPEKFGDAWMSEQQPRSFVVSESTLSDYTYELLDEMLQLPHPSIGGAKV